MVVGGVAGASAVVPKAPELVHARNTREEPAGKASGSTGKVETSGRLMPPISSFKRGQPKGQWRTKDD